MNWGKGLTLVYIAFIFAFGFLVYKTTLKKSEMVTDNYYQKELAYETTIQGKKNIEKLAIKPLVKVVDSFVKIEFSKELNFTNVKNGEVYFYRADNEKKDRKFILQIDTNNIQIIPIKNFTNGFYDVQLTWKINEIPYYFEQKIYI